MADLTLYHNPKCGKSRGAKEILESRGVDFELVEYLETPLSKAQIVALLGKLSDDPAALVRNDKRFEELGLDAADYQSADEVASLLAEHPELMQRPVGVLGDRAVIARPSELIETLL